MADEIIGTAVLNTSGSIEWLYHVRRMERRNGALACDELPVMPEDGTPPAERLPAWFPENKPWKYRIEGDILHVHPSVHIGESFHNAGAWCVKFVRAQGATRAECYHQLVAVNPGLEIGDNVERILRFDE